MVSDNNAGPRRKMLQARDDFEPDSSGEPHTILEGPGGKILRNTMTPKGPQEYRNEQPINSANYESQVGNQDAGVKRGGRDTHSREGEERCRQAKIEDSKPQKKKGHNMHL